MPDRPLAVAALAVWAVTASLGTYMLTRWIRRGGLRRGGTGPGQRPGLPPAVIFTHLGLAITGLLVWAGFVVSGTDAVGWLAAGLLSLAIGLGISTVTLWTPYPAYPPPAGGHGHGQPEHPGTRPETARAQVTGPAGGVLAGPAENALARRLTDETLARALTDQALASRLTEEVLASIPPAPPPRGRRTTGHMAPLIPVAHGMGAAATFLLVILSAIAAR